MNKATYTQLMHDIRIHRMMFDQDNRNAKWSMMVAKYGEQNVKNAFVVATTRETPAYTSTIAMLKALGFTSKTLTHYRFERAVKHNYPKFGGL